jgi:LiaF transmembrane domain/LiaI-LiaF-like transmembrane region
VPGLLIAAAGLILTLHNLNIIRIQGIWRFWPLILIGFGVAQVLDTDGKNRNAGIVLLSIGSFFQLANLDLISVRVRDLWRFWPLILIGAGVAQLVSTRQPRNLTAGLFLVTLGLYFQLWMLDLINVRLWQLWPVILIVIGIGMVERALRGRGMAR